jgi:uncharacterized membrane protein
VKLEQTHSEPITPRTKPAALSCCGDPLPGPEPAKNLSLNDLTRVLFFLGSSLFILVGAWPVSGPFSIEFGILCFAFRACNQQGRLKETASLGRNSLTVERITPDGGKTIWLFQPYWLQIKLHQNPCSRGYLTLSFGEKSMQLGSFLSPTEQSSLTRALE